MTTIKTVLHAYSFNIRKPEEKIAYEALRDQLEGAGLKCFETHGGGSHYCPDLAGPVDLETKALFDNQWNTAPIKRATSKGAAEMGARVFDWAQDYNSQIGAPPGIKRGHWLEQTADMRDIRRNTVKCRYCGAHEPAAKGYVFCPHCIDSAYLTEKDLPLTRMKAIDDRSECAPLTAAEAGYLLPLFRKAQVEGSTARGKARIAKARQDVATEYEKTVRQAAEKRDAAVWIMDHAPGLLENWLYYTHTNRHCFGWRKPVTDVDGTRAALAGFPFAYDIQTEERRRA